MNPICFYHKADLDGVCSAAIVKHFVPECELYGIDYGDEYPWDLVRPVDARAAGKLNDDRMVAGGYRKLVDALTPHVKRLKDRSPLHYTIAYNNPRS